jgi:hypothetical protein
MKTIEENFVDWESDIFGFGYGTGESHVLGAVKIFLDNTERGMHRLEEVLGPAVAWLLINVLCHCGAVDYGTSPRNGWLSPEGEALRKFFAERTVDQLTQIIHNVTDDYIHCDQKNCNCGPQGFQPGVVCPNPFWKGHHP